MAYAYAYTYTYCCAFTQTHIGSNTHADNRTDACAYVGTDASAKRRTDAHTYSCANSYSYTYAYICAHSIPCPDTSTRPCGAARMGQRHGNRRVAPDS